MLKLPKELVEALDTELDTNIRFESDNKTLLISAYSPAGQDCNLEIELDNKDTLSTLHDRVWGNYEDFDVSYETYLWLDNTGHGKNGAPYELEDVLNDMKWQEDWIKKVADCIDNFIK